MKASKSSSALYVITAITAMKNDGQHGVFGIGECHSHDDQKGNYRTFGILKEAREKGGNLVDKMALLLLAVIGLLAIIADVRSEESILRRLASK